MAKKFDITGFAMQVGAVVAGAAAAKMAEPLLAKIPGGAMVQNLAKVGVGGAAAFYVKNPMVKSVGLGFAAQGAYGLAAQYIPQLNGVGGVYGVGQSYMSPALPNYSDEVNGIFPEGDIIGATNYGETVGGSMEEEVQATLGLI